MLLKRSLPELQPQSLAVVTRRNRFFNHGFAFRSKRSEEHAAFHLRRSDWKPVMNAL
jgi:hypothetical protein